MVSKKRSPEENARREKIRELLHMANISSKDDIQNLFKETIAEFMEDGLEAELDEELGCSRYDYKNKDIGNHIYEAGSIETLIKIVDRNGGYTIIPELHIASLTEKQKAHVLPLQTNPPAQRHVSILIKEDFIRERMVNAVIDTLKSVIPAPMLEKRLSSHSIKLRHSKSE